MSAPAWRRRRAGRNLRRFVREQRRTLRAVQHSGHNLSPHLRLMLSQWGAALDDYDRHWRRR